MHHRQTMVAHVFVREALFSGTARNVSYALQDSIQVVIDVVLASLCLPPLRLDVGAHAIPL